MLPLGYISIAETLASTNHYHLRQVGPSGLRLGGGLSLLGAEGLALCGAEVAWDTSLPLTSWGVEDDFSRWCPKRSARGRTVIGA